ncbi:hypothetical protein [Nitrospira sp. M1]
MAPWTYAIAEENVIETPTIRFSRTHHTLSAHIDRLSFHHVLQQLANQLSITMTLQGVKKDHRFSTTFTDLPLQQGIERLLLGHDYALLYSQPNSAHHAQLKEIIVLPRMHASTSIPVDDTEIVMRPMRSHQHIREDQQLPYDSPRELRKPELTDFIETVETLVQQYDRTPRQDASSLSLASQDEASKMQSLGIALLKELESHAE